MKSFSASLALLAFSLVAVAAPPAGDPSFENSAPPAGHPPIERAAMPPGHPPIQSATPNEGHPAIENSLGPNRRPDIQLPQQGTVLSTINTGGYTYIEVKQAEQTLWIAAQAVAVKKGDVIRFDDGAVMKDFHSNSLDRTFPEVTFVSQMVVSPQ